MSKRTSQVCAHEWVPDIAPDYRCTKCGVKGFRVIAARQFARQAGYKLGEIRPHNYTSANMQDAEAGK